MSKIEEFQKKHRTEWQGILWDKFLEKIAEAKTKKEIGLILDGFFSDYEKQNVTKRLAAIALIRKGKSYKEIGEILWLSPATISALKKNMIAGSGAYKSQRKFPRTKRVYSSVPIHKKLWLDLFEDIDLWKLIKNPPRPAGIGLKQKYPL